MAGSEQKMPAVKLFIAQLDHVEEKLERGLGLVLNLQDLAFARIWIQGTVVEVDASNTSTGTSFLVDDGTGTIAAVPPTGGAVTVLPEKGRHVLLVGAVEISPGKEEQRMKSSCDRFRLLFDVIKDVGKESPNRETLWALEVVDFWKSRQRDSR